MTDHTPRAKLAETVEELRLQVNDSGAWRNVISFKPDKTRIRLVQASAATLLDCTNPRVTMRIATKNGLHTLAYCEVLHGEAVWRDV